MPSAAAFALDRRAARRALCLVALAPWSLAACRSPPFEPLLDGGSGVVDAARRADGGGDGGDDEFCSGPSPRVARPPLGPTVIGATSSRLVLNCCDGLLARFHTEKALGELASLMVTTRPIGLPLGTHTLEDRPSDIYYNIGLTIGATLYGSGISAAAGRVRGTIEISRSDPKGPYLARLCLNAHFPGDKNHGTRLYAPALPIMPYEWTGRLSFHLLKDRTIVATKAAQQPLANLVLEEPALLDLLGVAYFRAGDHFLAFDLGITPAALKNRIGTVPVHGLPFVVQADGQRLFLGAFWTLISSVSPPGPIIMIEQITPQGVPIDRLPDPLDPRLVKVLTEAGKLAP